MRYPTFRLTETGDGVVTTNLLLDTITDAIRRAYLVGALDDPACAHLVGAMETLGKMGLVTVENASEKPSGRPPVSTSPAEPPAWLADAFKPKGEDPDDGTPSKV